MGKNMEARTLPQSGQSNQQQAAVLQRHLLPVFPLALCTSSSNLRQDAEHFIYSRFDKYYGASINHFLPYILSAYNGNKVTAALGFQPATYSTPLFLEHYLDLPIESILSILAQADVERHSIVEIGNLASGRQRATQTLFLLLAELVHQSQFEWVVFTANTAVRGWLKKLNIETFSIQVADPSKLPNKGVNWGTYYDDKPVIVAANVRHTLMKLNANPFMTYLHQSYGKQLNEFSQELRK